MKIFIRFIFLSLLIITNAYSNDIKNFQIEKMRIGDSALDYFSEKQLEDNEQGWWNYSGNNYSTSLLPGKGIYDWFKISYKSDDSNFIIEGLIAIIVKKNYDNKECNKELDSKSTNILKLFESTKYNEKKLYKIAYDSTKIFYVLDPLGKSTATSVSFNFLDGMEINLTCYDMDKETNEIKSYNPDINQFDSFRLDIRSRSFANYLKKIT